MSVIETKKGDYLNDEQKQIKSQIIGEMLQFFGERITQDSSKFNEQTFSDLLLSVLMTLTRESFYRFVKGCGVTNKAMRTEVIREIFQQMKKDLIAEFDKDDKMKH